MINGWSGGCGVCQCCCGRDQMDSRTSPAPPFQRLSVVFPMWNEQSYIEHVVAVAREECERLVRGGEIADFELIIVDDASTDSTGRIADDLASACSQVRVVHHERNQKLGASIRTGFQTA